MEHLYDLHTLSSRTGIADKSKLLSLLSYANSIFLENKKFNLTGHKNLSDIIENLIIGSLEPIKYIDVPRGTFFADLGTGSGIPGVPFGIKHDDCSGILFDSNIKKISFINKTASTLGIKNVKGAETRIEDAGRSDQYREKFDLVFTRAMSDVFTISELGSPLLKTGGYLYLFVNENQYNFNDYLCDHISRLGLIREEITVPEDIYINTDGLLFKKIKDIDIMYPRRMPVIKRLAMK